MTRAENPFVNAGCHVNCGIVFWEVQDNSPGALDQPISWSSHSRINPALGGSQVEHAPQEPFAKVVWNRLSISSCYLLCAHWSA
jgi:hypothetical protein